MEFAFSHVRFHVLTDAGRVQYLAVTNCDFKLGWAQTSIALCLYGTWHFDALECPSQPSRNSGEHRDNTSARKRRRFT
jgi:hypothetical protein